MSASALAASECVADEPENEEHHSEKPQDVYGEAESGDKKNDEQCQ